MFSFLNARNALARWLSGGVRRFPTKELDAQHSNALKEFDAGDREQRIAAFLDELRAVSQDWLGRVRLINFDTIRERLGPSWPKLEPKIELLAEAILREEMSTRDRHLNIGNAEFLVFIADASPEEVRIRCLAIVEAIQEKLFGIDGHLGNPPRKIAETHVAHMENLALLWEQASSTRAAGPGRSPSEALHGLFRRDAELLDGADVTASAQIVIDLLITRAMESRNLGDLTPVWERLTFLDRSLAALEPALVSLENPIASPQIVSNAAARENIAGEKRHESPMPVLREVREDAAQLISALDMNSSHSHSEVLGALARLQRARAERAPKTSSNRDASSLRTISDGAQARQFEYCPVYRSVSRGEQVYQGIFRVDCRPLPGACEEPIKQDAAEYNQDSAATERLLLEHAIQFWAGHRTAARFILMVPLHIETLRAPLSQRRYSTILRAADLQPKRRLVVEVIGYDETDNTIAVRRAIDELRAQCHAVFVTLSSYSGSNVQQIAADLKKAGVHAFGLDISAFNGPEAGVINYLTPLAAAGQALGISTYVSGISTVPVLAKAIALGVSYVCAPALLPPRPAPREAEQTTLADLYSAV